MNRRGFLKGLISAGVVTAAAPTLIEEVSRVYSFPTNIVIAKPPLVQAAGYVPISFGGLQHLLVVYYDKKFIEHLKAKLPFLEMSQRPSLPPASDVPFFIEEDDSDYSDYYDLED